MPISSKAAVKISKKKITLSVGQKVQLYVTGSRKKVRWSSKNKKICKVSKKGIVTAKKKGSTYVKAKVGKKTLKCKVKVKGSGKGNYKVNNSSDKSNSIPGPVGVTEIKITGTATALAPGGTTQLSVSYIPANAASAAVMWGTSNRDIATVSDTGLVKAGLREGKVTIYAWIDDDKDKYKDSKEIQAEYVINVKNITAENSVVSADGGDLLLTENGAQAVLKYTMSDAVTDVNVNILDSLGTIVRTYSIGTVGANTETTCTWDLMDTNGMKVPAGNYCFEIVAAGASIRSDFFIIYAKSDFAGGNGSSVSPYLVSSLDELKLVNAHNGVYFRQIANIDVEYKEFAPLFSVDVPFNGYYDGNGYVISNINNPDSSVDNVGIFKKVGANGTVTNLKVSDCIFNGNSYVGVIVGLNDGNIINCTVSACSILADTRVGGICGYSSRMIKDCTVTDSQVKAVSQGAGGICGISDGIAIGCIVKSCSIRLTGVYSDERSGGIIGINHGNVSGCAVSECDIYGDDGSGGIAGWSNGTCVNNTYVGDLNQVG